MSLQVAVRRHRWKMVKCGPKPKQVSARQLRNLVREEKKAKTFQRPARLPPAPPSPRGKKRVCTRPSRYDVSLARKKQAKAKTRLVMVRRARTESSLAFSAITEEIPLIDIIKRERNLVYMPQAPVPLFYPMTPSPPIGKPSTCTLGASESVTGTPLELGYNVVPPNTPNEELEHPETPEPSPPPTTALASSPCDLGIADQTVDCGQVLDGALQGVSCLDVIHPSPHVESSVLRNVAVDNPSPCRRSSSLPSLPSLPSSQDRDHVRDFVPVQVLSQLPIEQELDSIALPRVLLPTKFPLLNASPKEKVAVMDSPETDYHRSLMSSIWAPADLSLVKMQPDLRDALHVHHPNSNINIKTELASVKIEQRVQGKDLVDNHTQSTDSCSNNSLAQDEPDPAGIAPRPQFGFKPNVHAENARGNFRSSRRVWDGYKSGHSLGTDGTPGAFANAVLRRTGHLGERSISPEIIPGNIQPNPLLCDSPVRKNAPKINQDRVQQTHGKSRLLNGFSFQATRSEALQSRAPAALPRQSRSDPRTLPPLASAAVIRDDPLRRPSVRPTRKRFISVGRVITYNATASKEEQACARHASNDVARPGPLSTLPIVRQTTQVEPKDSSRRGTTDVDSRTRSKRHWSKLVVSDDICHNVSMENTASPLGYRNTYGAQAPVGTSLAHVTGGTIKQRLTTTLRAVYNRLWA